MCWNRRGIVTLATIADHIEPHKGDWNRFLTGPLQSLCDSCHSGDKRRVEHGKKPKPIIGEDGWPTDRDI